MVNVLLIFVLEMNSFTNGDTVFDAKRDKSTIRQVENVRQRKPLFLLTLSHLHAVTVNIDQLMASNASNAQTILVHKIITQDVVETSARSTRS